MSAAIQCAYCGNLFEPNARVKNQRYCSHKECQRARKRTWQKDKLKTDPDYRANQRDCQKNWHLCHPGYYREYRSKNTLSVERNRLLQKVRDARRRPQLLAKMDELKSSPAKALGPYHICCPRLQKWTRQPLKLSSFPYIGRTKSACKRGLDSFA